MLHEGKILDGRNRFLACHGVMADHRWPDVPVDPPVRFVNYNGDDPLGFVISKNLQRRHLDESQRSMVAARLETLEQGRPPGKDANLHVSRPEAAETLNVSERSVASSAKVLDDGSEGLVKAVDDGKIAVSVAAKLADLPPEIQAKAVAEPDRAPLIVKQERRAEREREASATRRLPPPRRNEASRAQRWPR